VLETGWRIKPPALVQDPNRDEIAVISILVSRRGDSRKVAGVSLNEKRNRSVGLAGTDLPPWNPAKKDFYLGPETRTSHKREAKRRIALCFSAKGYELIFRHELATKSVARTFHKTDSGEKKPYSPCISRG